MLASPAPAKPGATRMCASLDVFRPFFMSVTCEVTPAFAPNVIFFRVKSVEGPYPVSIKAQLTSASILLGVLPFN